MEEDTEYLKQSLEDRLIHKLWKARVHGYEEATKLFRTSDDDKELSRFLGLVKKFVADSNAAAQERGLEAALAFAENYQHAGKNVGEVVPLLVAKCLSAPKTRTRELAVSLTLMYFELEKGEQVVDELLKGAEHKNPKTQAASIAVLAQALREFGLKAVPVKTAVCKLPPLLEHRDKGVRDEAKALAREMRRWLGPPLRAALASTLKPAQLTEIDAEFDKVASDKPAPTRLVRSQQKKQERLAEAAGDSNDGAEAAPEEPEDPLELVAPVDVLSALPKDMLDRMDAKKWQERKEVLDQLEAVLQAPKIAPGEFGDVVRALKKAVAKDSNVVVVACAVRCLALLAHGLGKRYAPYAGAVISPLLDKFKERKPAVVAALREAVDATLLGTSVEAIQEDVVAALESKNPQVKTETAAFLARAFTRCTKTDLHKKLLATYFTALAKLLTDPDPGVRDSVAEAMGTALRVVGEKAVAPLWGNLDAAKQSKICDSAEKAVIVAKAARPASAPAKSTAPSNVPGDAAKPVRRPATAVGASKKPVPQKTTTSAPAKVSASKQRPSEQNAEELDEKAALVFTNETLANLSDANWKTRLAAVEAVVQTLGSLEAESRDGAVLLSAIARKPGLRDTNFQALRARLDAVKLLAETTDLSNTDVETAVGDIALSLGDAKNGAAALEALTALATSSTPSAIALYALESALTQKSPKVQVEALQWTTQALEDFGPDAETSTLLAPARKALDATSPAVRAASVTLALSLAKHLGAVAVDFYTDDPPQNAPTLVQELAKFSEEVPSTAAANPRAGGAGKASGPGTDISAALDDKLMAELADKNWKVRMEALTRLSALVQGRVGPSLAELPQLLCKRLQDSNAKIAATALSICTALACAMGPDGRRHLRTFFPAIVLGLGDSKAWIREAALACLASWEAAVGVKEFFAGGEMVAAALDSGSPQLRAELCAWLANALAELPKGGAPKEEMLSLVAPVLATLDDRSPDVRKSGNAALGPLMVHVGFQACARHAEKLKPASRPAVLVLLEKARQTLPVVAAPTAPTAPTTGAASRAGSATMTRPKPSSAATRKVGPGLGPSAPAGPGRKREEEDLTPPLQCNKLKNQRSIDEQKLKILKWNFVTPRDEFVELLRDQLTTANASKTLIANMFHSDFKFHLKAIDQLSECLAADDGSTEANLDLVLKWMTLRFFDTNPSVLLRGLDYLQATFEMLWNKEYHMFETEAASFLPYLIVKAGDPKDAVRSGVRALVKITDLIYPRTKLFQHLLDGIKSKNARQRTECLELLDYMIARYGLVVCGPGSPAGALREIARQISDRDNSVRNAALNCVVAAFHLEGDRVVKMLGQIGDKEMSLLEERIKRAKKAGPKPVEPGPLRSRSANQVAVSEDVDLPLEDEVEEPEELQEPVEVPAPSCRRRPSAVSVIEEEDAEGAVGGQSLEAPFDSTLDKTAEFVLDRPLHLKLRRGWKVFSLGGTWTVVGPRGGSGLEVPIVPNAKEVGVADDEASLDTTFSLESAGPRVPRPGTQTGTAVVKPRSAPGPFGLDSHFLDQLEAQSDSEPLGAPHLHEFDLEEFRVHGPLPLVQQNAPPKHSLPTLSPPRPLHRYEPAPPPTPQRHLATMQGVDLRAAVVAINALDSALQTDPGVEALAGKADALVCAAVVQLRQLRELECSPLVGKTYRALLMVLMTLCKVPSLVAAPGKHPLKALLGQLIGLLAEDGLADIEGQQQLTRVINMLVVRLIDKADHTNLMCALVTLLHESVTSGTERHQELVMKCVWKVVKLLPTWDRLECNVVLHDIHNFFKEHPGSYWRRRPSGQDMPLRTVKTVLHALVKLHGAAILAQLDLVDDVQGSELHSYLEKLVKAVRMEEPRVQEASTQQQQQQQQRLSKSTHELLSEIFRKIGTKETTQDGLSDLFDFKQAHPEADIEPFLAKSSAFFQQYIEDGMRAIGNQRATGTQQPDSLGSECREASYYLDRLRSLQLRAGIETMDIRDEQREQEAANNRLNDDKHELSSILRPAPVPTATNIDQLRQRLDAVKGTNRQT